MLRAKGQGPKAKGQQLRAKSQKPKAKSQKLFCILLQAYESNALTDRYEDDP